MTAFDEAAMHIRTRAVWPNAQGHGTSGSTRVLPHAYWSKTASTLRNLAPHDHVGAAAATMRKTVIPSRQVRARPDVQRVIGGPCRLSREAALRPRTAFLLRPAVWSTL
jgi:hypothetical protein